MKKILISLAFASIIYVITFFTLGLANNHALLLSMVAFLIVLWTNEGLPLGVVSLLPLILFPLFELNDIKQVAQNYSHPIIFLFLGGFLISLAFEKTQLHLMVANKMIAIFPRTPRGRIYAVMTTSALLSSVLSNTTITLMLMPIVLFLVPPQKGSQALTSRFLIATAYGASIGGVLTPIGTPPNLILLGFIEHNQLPMFSFIGWIFMLLPVVAIMLLVIPFFLSIGLKSKDIASLSISQEESKKEEESQNKHKLTPDQSKLSIILLFLIGFLLLNSRYGDFYSGLGISESIILLGFGLFLFLPKVSLLEWEDTVKIPWEIIFLFGAGFSIADTMIKSELPSEIMKYAGGVENISLLVLFFILAFGVSMCTEVTSNTAFIAVILPILYKFTLVSGYDPRLILPVATVATSYAFMLPIATPPNAIVMASRMIKIRTMIKYGFVVNLIGVTVISLVAYFLW